MPYIPDYPTTDLGTLMCHVLDRLTIEIDQTIAARYETQPSLPVADEPQDLYEIASQFLLR